MHWAVHRRYFVFFVFSGVSMAGRNRVFITGLSENTGIEARGDILLFAYNLLVLSFSALTLVS
jgi:hypothetical protein